MHYKRRCNGRGIRMTSACIGYEMRLYANDCLKSISTEIRLELMVEFEMHELFSNSIQCLNHFVVTMLTKKGSTNVRATSTYVFRAIEQKKSIGILQTIIRTRCSSSILPKIVQIKLCQRTRWGPNKVWKLKKMSATQQLNITSDAPYQRVDW